ncbi:efflux RND transporter periplasmic adaptor subunit [Thalassotalea agariperforans]
MKLNISSILLTTGLAISISACQPSNAEKQAPMARPAQQVDVVTLTEQDVALTEILPARAVASKVAEVRPQVTGIILKRNFVEGGQVVAGQTLYQIDDAIYQANLASSKAQLAQTQANLTTAAAELKRYQALIKDKAVSQQVLDQAQAQFDAYKAAEAMGKAAVHKAEVDLSYTKVLAPISGQISKSNITEGAYVSAGQANSLATITQLDPIYFDMKQASVEINTLEQRIAAGELSPLPPKAELELAHQTLSGELLFHEVQVNPATDTVTLRAQFNNASKQLMPGMFARIKLTQVKRENSILVPQKTVQFNRQGEAKVFVLGADNKVEERIITIGRSIGSDWLVLSGLQAGMQVITTGLQKIAPGVVVSPIQANLSAE